MTLSDRIAKRQESQAKAATKAEQQSQTTATFQGFNGKYMVLVKPDSGLVFVPPSRTISTGAIAKGKTLSLSLPKHSLAFADFNVR
jgi:hypothetical protein